MKHIFKNAYFDYVDCQKVRMCITWEYAPNLIVRMLINSVVTFTYVLYDSFEIEYLISAVS